MEDADGSGVVGAGERKTSAASRNASMATAVSYRHSASVRSNPNARSRSARSASTTGSTTTRCKVTIYGRSTSLPAQQRQLQPSGTHRSRRPPGPSLVLCAGSGRRYGCAVQLPWRLRWWPVSSSITRAGMPRPPARSKTRAGDREGHGAAGVRDRRQRDGRRSGTGGGSRGATRSCACHGCAVAAARPGEHQQVGVGAGRELAANRLDHQGQGGPRGSRRRSWDGA